MDCHWSLLKTAILLLYCSTYDETEAASLNRPNIVFILADDLGWNGVGYHNTSEILTPNVDTLASSGVKLENYYVQPICTPTRSCLMSGRYQIHTGLQHGGIKPWQPNYLPLDSPTIADKMKEAGYATHMVGKWHLGFYQERYCPWKRGFDTFFGYLGGSQDYFAHTRAYKGGKQKFLDLRDQNGPVKTEGGHYSTNLFTEKAVNVVNAHDSSNDTPLFLYLAYQAVHGPLQVPQSYEDKYAHIPENERRTYAGMVSVLDEGIGNLTMALKQKGLWDNTILIFSTDNGGNYGNGANNFPLRGHKATHWEGGMRGVGFVSGGIKLDQGGTINRELIHVTDWYPTLVGLANGNIDGTVALDGVDQWDTINKGQPSKRKVLLHNIDLLTKKSGRPLYNDTFDTSVRAAVRVGDYKLLTGNPGSGYWGSAPGQKLTYENPNVPQDKNVWLFNIKDDPEERHDLSGQKPDVVRELLGHLQRYNATSVPARYPPKDPQSNPSLHGGVWGPWSFDDSIVG